MLILLAVVSYFFFDHAIAFFIHQLPINHGIVSPLSQFVAPAVHIIGWTLIYFFKRTPLTFHLASAELISGTISKGMKYIVGRTRPELLLTDGISEFKLGAFGGDLFQSCPSGHSISAFALGTVLALHFPKYRKPIYCATIAFASLRVLLGRHYMSDVLIGAFIGMTVAKAVVLNGNLLERIVKNVKANA